MRRAEPEAIARWLGVGLLAAAAVAFFWNAGPCDDDFIVYRYARNLVLGRGLVFNPGERVEGFTCPLWTLLLAGAQAIGAAPEIASRALGLASVVAAAWLALARRGASTPRTSVAYLAAIAIAASPALAFHATQGLGTALAGALIAGAYVASARAEERHDSRLLPALLYALAALLRPETACFLPPFLWAAPRGRRASAAAAIAAVVGGWLAFRLAYYGEWLPMTWYVKKLPFQDDLAYGTRYFLRATLETGIGLTLLVCVVARARKLALGERSATAALAGAVLTAGAVVFVGGDYMQLARFLVPILPLALILASSAVDRMAPAPRLAAAAFLVFTWPWARLSELRAYHAFDEERWIAIGRELARRAAPETIVATSPIGAIGFHSGLEIVDILGMTNAVVRNAPPDIHVDMKGHHRYDAEWVLSRAPDVVVLGNGVQPRGARSLTVNRWEGTLYLHPRFQSEYEPRTIEVEGSYPLVYFQRRGGRELR